MINFIQDISKDLKNTLTTYTSIPSFFTPIIHSLFLLFFLSFFLKKEFSTIFLTIKRLTPTFISDFFSTLTSDEVLAFTKVFLWLYFLFWLLAFITPYSSENNKISNDQHFFVSANLFFDYIGAILFFGKLINLNASNLLFTTYSFDQLISLGYFELLIFLILVIRSVTITTNTIYVFLKEKILLLKKKIEKNKKYRNREEKF